MAVAAPKRRSETQAAPAPARTTPPEPKKRPRDRPRPGGPGRSTAAAAPATAPKRKTGATKPRKAASGAQSAARASAATATPARKAAPRRKASAAPARKTAPKRRAPGRVIPLAAGTVGRTAVAVTQLPESGLIHRLTRGRAWIGVLGVLLIGIVGLNVVTLSFAASAGKVEERNLALSRDNSVAQGRLARLSGQELLHNEAKAMGLSPTTATEPKMATVSKGDVNRAAARLAAAAAGTAAATSEGEAVASEGGSGEGASGGVGMSAEEAANANLEGLSQEELNAIYEETLAREAAEAEGVVSSEVSYEEPVYEEAVTEVPTE
jgi:hypothetical protein